MAQARISLLLRCFIRCLDVIVCSDWRLMLMFDKRFCVFPHCPKTLIRSRGIRALAFEVSDDEFGEKEWKIVKRHLVNNLNRETCC